MNAFDVLSENPIKKKKVSRFRWDKFGVLHLDAIELSDKPEVMVLIPDATSKVNALTAIINLMGGSFSDRGLATVDRNDVYDAFYKDMVDLEYNVGKKFVDKPSVYNVEFFPGNLTEYKRAPISEQLFLINRIKTLTAKYETELGLPTKDLFAAYYTSFDVASRQKITKSNKVSKDSADYKNILDKFQDQMWKDMLVIGSAYLYEPGVAKTFFHPEVLHARHKNSKGITIDKPLEILLRSASILLADFTYGPTDQIIAENKGTVSFFYFTSDTELVRNTIPEDAIEVAAGDEVMLLGSSLKKYFYVANKETSTSVRIELSLM